MIYERFKNITRERTIKSLIGINRAQFDKLAVVFEETLLSEKQERYKSGELKRLSSGGNKGFLDTHEKQLFFILYYLKTYENFDVLGFHFGFSGGNAHEHVKRLSVILQKSLAALNVLPERPPESFEEFSQLVEKYRNIIIDGAESACVRPQEKEAQKAHYSGKKKDIH